MIHEIEKYYSEMYLRVLHVKRNRFKVAPTSKTTASRSLFKLIIVFLMTNLSANAMTNQHYGDTIFFSGFAWVVKESHNKQTGPGRNYFSGSLENVWVDSIGRLHLKLTNRDEKWFCPEIRMLQNLGYGKYIFHIEKFSQPLDKDVVVGLFLYDHDDSLHYNKEIDIEFSKWGKYEPPNTQFTVQPHEDKAHRFITDLSRPTIHSMEISKRNIHFISEFVPQTNADTMNKMIADWHVKPDRAYRTGNATISMNIWLYKASEPANLKEMEVIISKIDFIPTEQKKAKPFYPRW